MPLNHHTAALRLTREMKQSEQAIADALVATASLMHSAALAHRDAGGADPVKALATFKRIQNMTGSLIETQREAVRTHSLLLDIGVEVGAFEEPTCPEHTFTGAELEADAA